MDSKESLQPLHFVLIPLMSPGHLIPMIDMAKLLAQHGMIVTIVTTPLNSARFGSTVERAARTGLRICLLTLDFPARAAGLPDGCENMDRLTERRHIKNFFTAAAMLRGPLESALTRLEPAPSCLISGKNLGWTVQTCQKLRIPRLFFDGMGCFSAACSNRLESCPGLKTVPESEPIPVPGLPHKIELTRAQLPENLNPTHSDMTEVRDRMRAAESVSDGIVVNTFEELEPDYVEDYKRVRGENVWCIGPVSGCNTSEIDRADRGERTGPENCMTWLDARARGSVIYACLGSICGLRPGQLKELALGLEASNRPFLWVVRSRDRSDDLNRWLEEDRFVSRTGDRGLVVLGWAPQLQILSHPAVGAFLTHCGWNSTLEGLSAGVPLVTCPLFAEQFMNERLAVDVVGTGVSGGVEAAVRWGLEGEAGVVMRRERVREAIDRVFERSEEGERRRERAREIGEMAKRAIGEGGSSYRSMETMIHYVREWLRLRT